MDAEGGDVQCSEVLVRHDRKVEIQRERGEARQRDLGRVEPFELEAVGASDGCERGERDRHDAGSSTRIHSGIASRLAGRRPHTAR